MENKKNFIYYANLSIKEVFQELKTSEEGLSSEEAKKRLSLYGYNSISQSHTSFFIILTNQLINPFIGMFFVIALLYFFTHQITESIILCIIIIINTAIGLYQEYHSNKAMELLQSYIQSKITVRRNNKNEENDIKIIVPGDIVILKAGDIVPADCRIIESNNLVIDEASLTGESKPVYKDYKTSKKVTDLYDATVCAFAGTVIVDGSGIAIIFATGKQSSLGSIALLATQTSTKSNLANQTMILGKIILFLVLISLIVVMFINGYINPKPFSFLQLFFFAAALAITAIPSALPIVITFCLTNGAMALHKHKIIVKRLSSIEDLGNVEILCTDKTGTVTENILHVQDVYTLNDDGTLLLYATCDSTAEKSTLMSNSFDTAILNYLSEQKKEPIKNYTIIKHLPFTYERHRSIILIEDNNHSHYIMLTKGSAEYIVDKCNVTETQKKFLYQWIDEHESSSNRVLMIALKRITHRESAENYFTHETYDSLALISFQDPLKPTAISAIKKAQALNIQIKILSGDSAQVCFTIAKELGLETNKDNVVLGSDFEKATEKEKVFLAYNRSIFARVTPEQKYHIIDYLQKEYPVAYLGDGINDAPALKIAHVGIAVDKAAPVAREAAEIILLQKSLFNIILGIEEGRKIVINTLKYIKITISSNIGNFYSLSLSSLLINYLPMLPLQLLFLDLITDFPLISISTDTVSHKELQKPFHYSMKDIAFFLFLFGLISSPFDFLIFFFFKSDEITLQTNWFIASALTQLALIFSLRTRLPFWKAHRPSFMLIGLSIFATMIVMIIPFTQWGKNIFHFKQPKIHEITIICAITLSYFITTEITKFFYYRFYKNKK